MSTSSRERSSFADSVLSPDSMLDNAICWISNNLRPDEVFSNTLLKEWAEDNGFVKGED